MATAEYRARLADKSEDSKLAEQDLGQLEAGETRVGHLAAQVALFTRFSTRESVNSNSDHPLGIAGRQTRSVQ